MTQISLVLPFALPPPELAPDLVRAMQAPTLARLLTRSARHESTAFDGTERVLSHEQWLARELGLLSHGQPAFAAAAMQAYGMAQPEGVWFIVHPTHIAISRSHLLLGDLRRMALSEPHSRALFDVAKPFFDEIGQTLLYADAHTWFMRADAWRTLDTASPDAATGQNLTDWMPSGPVAVAYRRLQNEVQMMWHEHPVNAEREARGLPAINAFWPWGAVDHEAAPGAPSANAIRLPSSPVLSTIDAPSWLAALAQGPADGLPDWSKAATGHSVLYCGSLCAAAIATDWADWLQHMQRLEQDVFAPVFAALQQGRIGRVRLLLSHRAKQHDITTSAMAQRAFWRRPTLDRLLP